MTRDLFGLEDAVEGAAELRVAVVDQEAGPLAAVVEVDLVVPAQGASEVPVLTNLPSWLRLIVSCDASSSPFRSGGGTESFWHAPQPGMRRGRTRRPLRS